MFGLSFANPAVLYGLWAALLPLVIHLLNRRRTVTVAFSNVALLQALQHDRMRQVKIKQILLLILRTLLIVLLVLAFARPTLTGASGDGRDAGTSAVILLDRSMSMRFRTPDGTLFDRAKTRMEKLLGVFDARDDVQVLLVDSRATPIDGQSADQVRLQLAGLQPGFDHTDFRAGIEAALSHLRASQLPNKELYVATDLARNGWATLPDTLADMSGISVFLLPEQPASIHNLGILDVRLVGDVLQVGRLATLEIEVINYGDVPRGGVPVQAFLNDRRIAQEVVHVPARGKRKLHVRFTPDMSGALSLRVEIGDDDLTADNTRVLVLVIPEKIRVLLIRETPEDTYYLAQALQVAACDVIQKQPDDVTEDILQQADVIYVCHVATLSRGIIDGLHRRLESGAGLGIFLGRQVDIRHYNAQVLPVLLPAMLTSVQGRLGEKATYQTLQSPLPDHPLLVDLQLDGPFHSPKFYAYYGVSPQANTQPVLSFATGTPALLECRIGSGRAVLFSSGLHANLTWNEMPVAGFFLPFMHRLTGYLAVGAFGQANYVVGQTVYRDIRSGNAKEAVLRAPGQEAQTLWPEQQGSRSVWPIGVARTPGLWELFAQERLSDRFAVQVHSQEADLTPISETRLSTLFRGARVAVVTSEMPLSDVVLSQRRGRELWRFMLAGALVFMALEMVMTRSTQTRRDAP